MTDTVSMSYRKPYREDVIIKKKNNEMLKNLIASSLRLLFTKYVLFTTNDVK